MTESEQSSENFPSLVTVVRGTLGYFAAGVACTLAGHSLSGSTALPSGPVWVQLSVFWFLLGAGLACHAALYEQRGMTDRVEKMMIRFAWEVPILAAVAATAIAVVFHAWHQDKPDFDQFWAVPFILAALPLDVLSIHRGLRWGRDPKLFTFRSRSYFPALATCLPAFILGYYLEEATLLLLVAGALILIAWVVSLRTSLLFSGFAQGGVLLIAIGVVFFFGGESLRICMFGFFLTLAMGVAEAWRVTTRILAGVEYRPRWPYKRDESDFFLAATNVATALFLPLFLTTFLHPQTQLLYLLLIFITLTVGYVLWFTIGRTGKYKMWTIIAFVFGITLPAELAVGAQFHREVHALHLRIQSLGAIIPLVLAAISFASLAPTITEYIRMYRKKQSFISYYLHAGNAIALTGVISAILAIVGLIPIAGFTMIAGDTRPPYDRINWLVLAYMGLAIGTAVYRWLARAWWEANDAT